MKRVFVAPSRAGLAGLLAGSVVVSVALYVAFFIAIGDPTGILGTAHGDYQAVRLYYKPILAVTAACLALLSPEASLLTAPLFAATQIITCIACCALTEERKLSDLPLVLLGLVVVVVDVVPWVVAGAIIGAAVRIVGRVIAGRGGRQAGG